METFENQNIDNELDYFRLYLVTYLNDNKIDIDVNTLEVIDSNTDTAYSTYCDELKNGMTISDAMEAAIKELFQNVGVSEYSIVSDVLVDEFKDDMSLETDDEIKSATRDIRASIPNLFEGISRCKIGISPEDIDKTKTIITGRISQFIDDHGL